MRILESGRPVYGFGERKTPHSLVDACSPFIYVENLISEPDDTPDHQARPKQKSRKELRGDAALVRLLRTAVEQTSDDDGWSHLGRVGDYISNNNSSFSTVNYGYKKLKDLLQASDLFDLQVRGTHTYLKDPKA
jgi:hypothetical protein